MHVTRVKQADQQRRTRPARPRGCPLVRHGRRRGFPMNTTATTAALSPQEAARLLRAMQTTVEAELSALPAAAGAFIPAPGEWCINEALGHLIESEKRGFAGRIQLLL